MMKHYNGVLISSLPFLRAPRIGFGRNRCRRFRKFHLPDTCWKYSGDPDSINFSVNKPIKLYGVQHFGSEGGEYTVTTEVKDTEGSSLVKQSGVYISVKDETEPYDGFVTSVKDESEFCYGFDVQFDSPLCLEKSKLYKLVSLI